MSMKEFKGHPPKAEIEDLLVQTQQLLDDFRANPQGLGFMFLIVSDDMTVSTTGKISDLKALLCAHSILDDLKDQGHISLTPALAYLETLIASNLPGKSITIPASAPVTKRNLN